MPRFPWPPIALLTLLLAGSSLRRFFPLEIWPDMVWLRYLGGALIVVALITEFLVAARMRVRGTTVMPNREASSLVTDGPFAYSRNPIYLGHVSGLLGAALLTHNPYHLASAPALAIALTYLAIRPEEAYLRTRFGPAYAEYCQRVRRWL